jgi:TolB protein
MVRTLTITKLTSVVMRGFALAGCGSGAKLSQNYQIYVVGTGGAKVRRLTHGGGSALAPAWSPDGHRLVFAGPQLTIVSADGRERDEIAFAANIAGEPRTHLYVIEPNGRGLRRLTGEIAPVRPAWSPSGRKIAFATYGPGIDTIRPDATGRMTLVHLPGAEIRDLAWSPNGRTLAFTARRSPPAD